VTRRQVTEIGADSEASGASGRPLRICLAGSGGGHVRQLLDLESVWSAHDAFFLTEDTALGQSVAEKHRTHFVTHVAVGQAKLGAPGKMLIGAVRNFFQSAKAMLKERPDVLLSTGAGAMFFGLVWARLLGAKIVVIDSFARFDRPSLFARIAAPLAHRKVVQSKALSRYFPDAKVFDPLRRLEKERPAKQQLLFATVGATLPFDRLVNSVAKLKAQGLIPERVIAQVGTGGARPEGLEAVETLPFEEIQRLLKDADIVVCHGGTGSLITALREGCRVISMPRLFELGEHYDNHQAEITEAFVQRGLIGMAKSEEELASALEQARARTPVLATTDPSELKNYLESLLLEWNTAARAKRTAAKVHST
jgi:UDP-N-acetylglucosamine transferase subunit ALG13